MTRRGAVSYGEALVDFLPDRAGVLLRDVDSFHKSVGGAPANVSVGIARLGCDVAHIGMVGEDEFGHFLRAALASEGVDVTGLGQTTEAKTGITFISLSADGDRSFLFFRERSAELTLRPDHVDTSVIDDAEIFVAGSNLLMDPVVRTTTYFALDHARKSGALVVLDPNIRLHLWPDRAQCIAEVRKEIARGDVVKVNDEELALLCGPDASGDDLWNEVEPLGVTALVVTHAEAGATAYTHSGVYRVSAPRCEVLDTTGAGDGFVAGLVAAILRLTEPSGQRVRTAIAEFGEREWKTTLGLGCWVGTQVCTRLGATPGLPRAETIPWTDLGF